MTIAAEQIKEWKTLAEARFKVDDAIRIIASLVGDQSLEIREQVAVLPDMLDNVAALAEAVPALIAEIERLTAQPPEAEIAGLVERLCERREQSINQSSPSTPETSDEILWREAADMLVELARRPSQAGADGEKDTARMNWLLGKCVNVRDPLPYGSRDMFWSVPEDVEGGPDGPSDLREQIDAYMKVEDRSTPPAAGEE